MQCYGLPLHLPLGTDLQMRFSHRAVSIAHFPDYFGMKWDTLSVCPL